VGTPHFPHSAATQQLHQLIAPERDPLHVTSPANVRRYTGTPQ
jgi:hypothetical protein